MRNCVDLIFCVEKGLLEQQAKLLINSVKQCFMETEYVLHAYSPRKDFWPSKATIDFFLQHEVQWCNEDLNTGYLEYPIANKVLACRHFEKKYRQTKTVIFLDTDTIFLNEIESKLLDTPNRLYLRPVDNKGPGSESHDDPNDYFWQQVFNHFKLKQPDVNTTTTVRKQIIRGYYNAGLIWSQGLDGFFEQWYQDFNSLVQSGFRPNNYKSRDFNDFRCLDQVALAVTASRFSEDLEILPPTYNFPIPFKPILDNQQPSLQFENLVHVHYHKWFQHPKFLEHILSAEELRSQKVKWLIQHLPIEPTIFDDFKC